MRRIAIITATLAGLATMGLADAQAQTRSTNPNAVPNAPGTLPEPGGGNVAGTGAPTSASPGAMPTGRGAPPPEPVGGRARRQQQSAEGQGVGAGHPLQGGGAAAEVATDGRQRDGQQRVVDHLDEEGQAEREQRDPRRPQGGVRAGDSRRRC